MRRKSNASRRKIHPSEKASTRQNYRMTNSFSTDHLWMPFTANRQFKRNPRMLVSAAGMYFTADDGRRGLGGAAGRGGGGAGRGRPGGGGASRRQAATLD